MNANKGPDDGQAEHSRIARAAGLLAALTFVSRVAGLARDIVIGALFGASPAADAFFVAFRIPNLMRRVVAEGATSTAFVPVFTAFRVEEGDHGAARAAAAVGAAAVAVLAVLVVFGVVFSDPLISLFAPGFASSPEKRELTVSLTRWTFPYLFFVGLAAWAMGCLHTFRRFTAPAIGPVLLNLSIIACALLLAPTLERPVYALVAGVLIGGFLQFAVQAPSLRACGVRVRDMAATGHPAIRRVGGLMVATLLGATVYQINILVATVFASLLPDRSVSYLWYGDRVFEFPLGIIAVAVGTAALPSLSGQATAKAYGEMASSLGYSLRLVWALCLPATIGLWMLAPLIVSVLFQRGEFTAQDSAMTAWALRSYCAGLLGVASVRILAAAFYAMETPRIPVAAGMIALVVNAVADLALMGPTDPTAPWRGARAVAQLGDLLRIADLDHAGLALGTSVAATVNAVVLLALVRRRLPAILFGPLAVSLVRHAAAGAVMAASLVGLRWGLAATVDGLPAWLELCAAVGVGAGVFLVSAVLLGSEELGRIVAALPGRRGRNGRSATR